MGNIPGLKLDEKSLEMILNYIMKNVDEDREMALQHHDTLATLLQGAPGDGAMSGLEIQLMVEQLSDALTKFLNTASKSTESALKIAKILSDVLLKMDPEETLTDEDRAEIEAMTTGKLKVIGDEDDQFESNYQ